MPDETLDDELSNALTNLVVRLSIKTLLATPLPGDVIARVCLRCRSHYNRILFQVFRERRRTRNYKY